MTQEELNRIIGKNVRKYRLLYNVNVGRLTQKDLAKQVGISTPMIGSLESDNCSQGVSIYNLFKISEILEVSIEKFFEKYDIK